MNKAEWAQRIFAIVFIVAWIGFAAVNLVVQAPTLETGIRRGWDFESRLENIKQTANGSFIGHNIFQDINGHKNLLIDRQMVSVGRNTFIIRGAEGYLYYFNNYPYETYDFTTQALQLKEVQNLVEEKGGTLLFVNCPDLYIEGFSESEIPVSNMNPRSNAFLYSLQGQDVPSIDARKILADSELLQSEYRYKTEPHWTTQAGFEIYFALLDWMEEQGSTIGDNYTNRNNYSQTMYQNVFSGQMGKQVGIPYAGHEDFVLIKPDFDTSFTLSYHEKSLIPSSEGDFTSVLLEQKWMNQESPYQNNMYNTYLTSLFPFRQVSNNLNQDGPKILLIGDSYMLPVASLLSTATSELCLLWPYGLPEMDEDVETLLDFIEINDFDHVIVGMSPGSMHEGGFNFLEGIEISE